jgi:predicted LPLAT superfamily acyltransferase
VAVRSARIASRDYLRRNLRRPVTLLDIYRHIFAFATTIHDRVFLLNDRLDIFDIQHVGAAALHSDNADKGIFLFGAHLGSFEVLHSFARANPTINIYMAMYPENARQISRAMASINPDAAQNIIELGQLDATLKINEKLQEGALVGVLADRASSADKYQCFSFLGDAAYFPCGPFRMAAMLRYPIYFMTGLYRGGNRYDIHFELLEDFSQPRETDRDAAVQRVMAKYVATLERYCIAAPFNWFNFFDFWEDHRFKNA